jgi:branched-chain amino acid transport system substrate-binding protein
LAAAFIAGSVLLAACGAGGSTSTGTTEPYQILFVGPQSGFSAANGTAMSQGAKAAVDYLNANGGVAGRQVALTVKDDQTDSTKAVTVLQEQLSGSRKPDLVITGVSSNESLAMAPLLTRQKIVGSSNVSSPLLNDQKQFPYFFSTALMQSDVVGAAVQFLKQKGTAKHVALVIQDDALRKAVAPAFEEQMKAAGFTTSEHPFAPDAIDISPSFEAAKRAGADWIYIEAVGSAVPRVFEGRVKAGAENIPAIGGSGIATTSFTEQSTPQQRQSFYPVLYPLTQYIDPKDRSAQFNTLFEAVGGNKGALPVPISIYAYGWDTVQIWAAAVQQAGSADGEKVAQALEKLDVPANDRKWLMWNTLYTPTKHFPTPTLKDLTFSQVSGRKDTMFVPTTG